MKIFDSLALALLLRVVWATDEPSFAPTIDDSSCSGQENRFRLPSTRGRCTNWPEDDNMVYPDEFDGIFSEVKNYVCEESGLRIIVSNSMPDHDVTIHRDTQACEIPLAVIIPLDPATPDMNTADEDRTEVPIRGMIAIAKNGVPAYGPQESDGLNAVEATESSKFEAGYWYGHPGKTNGWHVHNPQMGVETVNSETFLGWAMDGFEIYGPLDDSDVDDLDKCNGRIVDGKYQYHVRTLDQVDESDPYCDGDSPVTGWNYIFGCYAGDISESDIEDASTYTMPSDCVLESKGDCTDDLDYQRNGNSARTCTWVADNTASRCIMDDGDVANNCPGTCNDVVACYVPPDNGGCEDDASYLRNGQSARSCSNWVVDNPTDRCQMDAGSQHEGFVKDWCQETCGQCDDDGGGGDGCADDSSYLRNGQSARSCANWVADNTDRCDLDAGNQHEGLVSDWCQETCGQCDDDGGGGDGCADDSSYLRNGKSDRSCANWAVTDPDAYCTLDAGNQHEGLVSDWCKETCGGCDLNPTVLPNIIIMQPDDLVFFDDWGRPPKAPNDSDTHSIPDNDGNGLPNLETLRTNGLQMMQAYTASAMCGTSRYSTITGKNPSRAASSRRTWGLSDPQLLPAEVTIPSTKLRDTGGLEDCTVENLAAAFKSETEYQTGMFGKWHLSRFAADASYNYADAVTTIQECGFDTVGGLYVENMDNDGFIHSLDDYSHNMEWVTYEAIKFINSTVEDGKNFMMYFNPTVPHRSQNVEEAINDYNCSDTADPNFNEDIYIEGMVEEATVEGCRAYRDSVVDRADGDADALGQIWVDDAVGALMKALEAHGILDDTIILFQEDHGMDAKSSMYEGGTRIPQFIHYPAGIAPGTFEAPVSTIDIAPTMMEFGGITTPPYDMDGTSWKTALTDDAELDFLKNERCLYFELERDRAVRCGCYKYLEIYDDTSGTYTMGTTLGLANAVEGLLFDLCGGGSEYDHGTNQETSAVTDSSKEAELMGILTCHQDKTDPEEDPDYTTDCTCIDDTLYLRNGNSARSCANWVVDNPTERCDMDAGNQHDGDVKDWCKVTCGQCSSR